MFDRIEIVNLAASSEQAFLCYQDNWLLHYVIGISGLNWCLCEGGGKLWPQYRRLIYGVCPMLPLLEQLYINVHHVK